MHLLNCHGEWTALFALISMIPFIKVYFNAKGK